MTAARGARRHNPLVGSTVVLAVLVVIGLTGIGIAWRGLAASLVVSLQLPYAVSGALGGLALVGFALGIVSIQATRRAEALERAETARIIAAGAELLAALRPDDAS